MWCVVYGQETNPEKPPILFPAPPFDSIRFPGIVFAALLTDDAGTAYVERSRRESSKLLGGPDPSEMVWRHRIIQF